MAAAWGGGPAAGGASRPSSASARDGGTFTMYHGTSASVARLIEKGGFQQSTGGMLGRGVYCSRQPAKAQARPVLGSRVVFMGPPRHE